MPKLLQINATCNWGSTGHIAEQIAVLAEGHGWDCYIAHGARYVRKSSIKTIPIGSKIGNMVHALVSLLQGRHGLSSTRATNIFIESIRSINPDIIHLHNIHGYYINYKILFEFLKESNIPVVWTLHDCWSMTGQCTHFESVGCEKWQTGCEHCSLLGASYKTLVDRSRKNWELKKSLFSSVDNLTIVPVSHWLEDVVKKSYLQNLRTVVIHNGIDLKVFRPVDIKKQDLGLDEDKRTVLGVSSEWGAKKGLNDFIELSKNSEIQVVLIGVTAQQKAELPKNIIAVERTHSQEELAKYYSVADVFVNPTYEDSLPTVNLEALACGTPIVTYRTGGSTETIDEKTGIVVEKGDIDGLLKAIRYITEKGKASFLDACRDRAVNCFNKEIKFEEYIHLYNSLLVTK